MTKTSSNGTTPYEHIFGQSGLWHVTPELAGTWSMTSQGNRPIRYPHIQRLLKAMESGAWDVNGETLKFDTAGSLIDGHHRLLASIEGQVSFDTYAIFGVAHAGQQTVDIGLKRSPGDMLHLLGETNTNNLAATLRWVWRYEHGLMDGYTGCNAASIKDLEDTLTAWPQIRAAIPYGSLTQRLITRSLGSALYHLMARTNEEEATRFFQRVADGENLTRQSPIYLLRNRLIANSQAKARLSAINIGALVIKAWNAVIEGKSPRFIKWQEGQGEVFPRLAEPQPALASAGKDA